MNKVILLGRLTAKPELRYTPSNTAYTRFSVAVNRAFARQDGTRETDFINVVAWGKNAETIARYFDKGRQICLEGSIRTGSYTDKDGNKRYTTDVNLDSFEFVESKRNDADSSMPAGNPYDFENNSAQTTGASPYDFQNNQPSSSSVNVENDPFADFGDSVSIDDNFLD